MIARSLLVPALLLAYTVDLSARELTPIEKHEIADRVAHNFKDPFSAQFRWMPTSERHVLDPSNKLPADIVDKDGKVVMWSEWYCGMVNAKNSYGAYAGFTPFRIILAFTRGKLEFVTPLVPNNLGETGPRTEKSIYQFCEKMGFDLETAK